MKHKSKGIFFFWHNKAYNVLMYMCLCLCMYAYAYYDEHNKERSKNIVYNPSFNLKYLEDNSLIQFSLNCKIS